MSAQSPYTAFQGAQFHKLVWEAPGVLRVSLNRPPVNAWHDPMWRETTAIFKTIRTDSDVRAVVLNAEGRMFTAGLDLHSQNLAALGEGTDDVARRALRFRSHIIAFQGAVTAIEQCERPVIAAVHGICYGMGIDLLCGCDVRFASDDTKFCIKEVDVGLAADIGTLQRFPKIVGNDSVARELALTARVFDAREAERIGFISRTVGGGQGGVLAVALDTAKEIASKSPIAIIGTKVLMLHSRDHTVAEGLDYTALWNSSMLQTSDLPVAMASALQKKKATFEKL